MALIIYLVFSLIIIIPIVFYYIIYPKLKTYAYKSNEPCVSFETFKTFYDVCPSKFFLGTEYFSILHHPWQQYFFKTNRDARKYRRFKINLDRLKKQEYSAQLLVNLSDTMSEEINQKIKQIKQQLNEANKEQQEIIERLKNQRVYKGW